MSSPFSEPTQLVQIFGSYKSQVRGSLSSQPLSDRASEKRPLATKLMFDETMEPEPKLPRFNRDPFDNITGRKRFASENVIAMSSLQTENQDLLQRIKQLEADRAGDLANFTKLENRLKQTELSYKKERIEWDQKIEKATRLYKTELDKQSELVYKLKKVEGRREDREERHQENRRQSLDKTEALEAKVRSLRDSRSQLQEKASSLQAEVNRRPDTDRIAYAAQVEQFRNEIEDLRHDLGQAEAAKRSLQTRADEYKHVADELRQAKEENLRYRNQVDRLQSELEANREAVVQRHAMQDKLNQFQQMQSEMNSLRNRNKLLVETQGNIELLKEQIRDLTDAKARSERKAQDRDAIRAELEVTRQQLKCWLDLVAGVTPPEKRGELAQTGINTAREIIHNFQNREVELVHRQGELKNEISALEARLANTGKNTGQLNTELVKVKGEQAEQARLIKKLQRKLLLVTKERDSVKQILNSVEKEMTLSGNQWEQQKIISLEKTLDEYKAMVNMLMEREGVEGADTAPQPIPVPVDTAQLDALKQQLAEKEAECLRYELELERRAIKGDFNPADTKVLHFQQNPMSMAVERQRQEAENLQEENSALKARITLLEEGQTKDLTIMVGHKLEEGTSSKEVQDLKEQIKSSDLKNQRIMEMFKKTSKEFREVVLQTTGYRIDKSGENNYKLYPMYSEDKDSFLIFKHTQEEGIQLLESEFSLELSELMELHLEQYNSIPMFLAGIIMELFRRTQEGMEDDERSNEDDDDVDEEENEEDDDVASRSGESGADSDDVICVESD